VTLNGYHIPTGAQIIPLQHFVHNDPNLWDEPEAFKPERFINAEGRVKKPDCFLPFGVGECLICIHVYNTTDGLHGLHGYRHVDECVRVRNAGQRERESERVCVCVCVCEREGAVCFSFLAFQVFRYSDAPTILPTTIS